MTETSLWHIALTEPGADRIACEALRNRRYQVYRPIMPVLTRQGRGRTKTDWRSMFPGYLFVKNQLVGSWEMLRNSPGIRYGGRDEDRAFLRINGELATIRDDAIDFQRVKLVEQSLSTQKLNSKAQTAFKVGEIVRIEDGPFTGLWGKIQALDDNERICLLMSLFGRESRVSVESHHLMPA